MTDKLTESFLREMKKSRNKETEIKDVELITAKQVKELDPKRLREKYETQILSQAQYDAKTLVYTYQKDINKGLESLALGNKFYLIVTRKPRIEGVQFLGDLTQLECKTTIEADIHIVFLDGLFKIYLNKYFEVISEKFKAAGFDTQVNIKDMHKILEDRFGTITVFMKD